MTPKELLNSARNQLPGLEWKDLSGTGYCWLVADYGKLIKVVIRSNQNGGEIQIILFGDKMVRRDQFGTLEGFSYSLREARTSVTRALFDIRHLLNMPS